MPQNTRQLIASLNRIRRDLGVFDAEDELALIQIGTSLEELIEVMPENMAPAIDLLYLCLEGLQAIYTKAPVDCKAIVNVIGSATIAVEQFLSSPDNVVCRSLIERATEALTPLVKTSSDEASVCVAIEDGAPSSAEPASEASSGLAGQSAESTEASTLSLDDIMAMLVPLEHDDRDGLTGVKDALATAARSELYAEAVRHHIRRAAERIGQLLDGADADAKSVLSDVGYLLEEAAGEAAGEIPLTSVSAEGTAADQSGHGAEAESHAPASHAPESHASASHANAGPAASESTVFALLPHDADNNLIADFVIESGEFMQGAEAALLTLEGDPTHHEAINTVFRAFHTIKGTAAFIGLQPIADLSHLAESLLSRMRDGEIHCTGGYADLALKSTDAIKELLKITQLAIHGEPPAKPSGYDKLMAVLANPEGAGVSATARPAEAAAAAAQEPAPGNQTAFLEDNPVSAMPGQPEESARSMAPVPSAPSADAVKKPVSAKPGVSRPQASAAEAIGVRADSLGEASVRVRTDRLDRLINMVGELVIAQSMVAQDEIVAGNQHELARKVSHANKIVRELQDLSMGMRMLPLKATFQKMTRLVRDLARKSGKLVEFTTEGEETEIDRHMVDITADPLVHMIRNAVDHGLESPEDREKAGKQKTGKLRLAAYHMGGNVVVELRDDGRGLNRDKILSKAIQKGLVDNDKLTDSEVYNLIFAPGFSTADKITDISGRGVGLDVVKRNVEALRGKLEISSEPGHGCTFRMRLPLTLAITDGMLIKVGHERYIIPTGNIHLSFQPERENISTVAGKGEMVLLRGELMPVFRLHRLFDVTGAVEDLTQALLVVVADGDRRCALLVDELLGQQQVVAKSLGAGIGKVQGVSGGAILGDGRVGLILDPTEIIALVRQSGGPGEYRTAA